MRARFFIFMIFMTSMSFTTISFGSEEKVSTIQSVRGSLALGEIQLSDLSTENAQAKEHFLLGVTFLESFMYDLAIIQFQEAQKQDPGFAMSYWGEVMAMKHPIWHFENLPGAI